MEKSGFWDIRKLLDTFIEKSPSNYPQVATSIQTESIYTLTLGFSAFYPSVDGTIEVHPKILILNRTKHNHFRNA